MRESNGAMEKGKSATSVITREFVSMSKRKGRERAT